MSLVSIVYASILIFAILALSVIIGSYFYNYFNGKSKEQIQKVIPANRSEQMKNNQYRLKLDFPPGKIANTKVAEINRVTLIRNLETGPNKQDKSSMGERFKKIDELKP